MVEKTAAFRQRRAADTARWRERLHRGAAVYPVEVDGPTFDLMERFAGLKERRQDRRPAGCRHRPREVDAPRAGGVAAGRSCSPALGRALINAGIGQMSALGANRTRRDGGNDVKTYLVTIRRGGALGVCSAGEITNVTQAFHPSGRFWLANSQ